MLFKVTDIQFDFITDDDELSPEEQLDIIEETCATVWEACDEDDLIEEITCATSWCILNVEYVHVLA